MLFRSKAIHTEINEGLTKALEDIKVVDQIGVLAESTRTRKLLMHRREIMKLIGKVERAGYTLIPLDLHFTRGRVKVTLALARGKREYEKRADESKKEWKREQERLMKRDSKGHRAFER